VPTAEITCEFVYPRPPWLRQGLGDSLMLWWGKANARFPEAGNTIELEYPASFGRNAPEIEPLDQVYSVFWKDNDTDEYVVRYQLTVEERA